MTITPFTSLPGLETAPAFSPDGSRIVFSWDNQSESRTGTPKYDLYVKAIGSETMLKLTNHPSDWISSTWSPDGTQIAFHRASSDDNAIYVVPALGGPGAEANCDQFTVGLGCAIELGRRTERRSGTRRWRGTIWKFRPCW